MKTSLILILTIMAGCATSYVRTPDPISTANKIAGIYVHASSDGYYEDLDCVNRPYFEELQHQMARGNWIPVSMNQWMERETKDIPRLLKEAGKRKLGYFIFVSYSFSGHVGDILCRRVYIKAVMYRVPTKKIIFSGWAGSKDVEIFDKYPATEAGYYPDSYPNTTRYYTRRPVSWDTLCSEALEKAFKDFP